MDSKFNVSLKVAKLLKEKGYDKNVNHYYSENGLLHDLSYDENYDYQMSNNDLDLDHYAAPTKSEAIHWIECNHYLRISIIYVEEDLYEYEIDDLNSGSSTSGFASSRLGAEDEVIIRCCEVINGCADNGV